MRRMKRSLLMALVLLLGSVYGIALPDDYRDAMEEALKRHGGGSFASEQGAAQAFVEIAEKHADEWLPYYWASYLYTQLANFHGRLTGTPEDVTQLQLVEDAQRYLDLAKGRVKSESPMISSDLSILQHFVHTLKVRFSAAEGVKKNFQSLADDELQKAIAANPNNPLIHTIVAIDLAGRSRDDVRGLLASRVMLSAARQEFETSTEPRALTTAWNQEWVGFWLERISTQLMKVAREQP